MTQVDHHNSTIGLNARSNGKDRSQLKAIYQQFTEGKSIEELHHIIQQFEQQPEAVK